MVRHSETHGRPEHGKCLNTEKYRVFALTLEKGDWVGVLSA